MLDFNEDLKNTILLLDHKNSPEYSRLYFATNEAINEILSYMDFTGKKVLSVLASGDQAFHLFDHNATNIDLFDKNKITIYFYYLRIWFIEYFNTFCLPLSIDNFLILDLLKEIKPQTEEEEQAYEYWKELIKYLISDGRLFSSMRQEYPKKLIEINNIEKIKEQLKLKKFNFYNIDIADSRLSLNKKYDFIYISNIIDWVRDKVLIKNMVRNLNNLLSDSGTIICADLAGVGPRDDEQEIFRKNFRRTSLPITRKEKLWYEYSPGYCYKKK